MQLQAEMADGPGRIGDNCDETTGWERVESSGCSFCHRLPLLEAVPPLGELHPPWGFSGGSSHGLGPPGDSIFWIETTWNSSASPRKPAGVRQPEAKSLESCGYSPSEKISLLSAEEADPDRLPVPEPPFLRSKHALVLLQSCCPINVPSGLTK